MSRKRFILTIGSILLVSTVLYFEMSRFAPNRFIIKSHIIESQKIPVDMNNISIVYMSDIHGDIKNLNKAINHVNKIKPDLILFSGNLFSENTDEELKKAVLNSLHMVNAPLGKFALISVNGNEAQMHELARSNFSVINNNSILISKTSKNPIEINFYGDDASAKFENNENNFVISLIEDSESAKNINDQLFDVLLSGNDTDYISLPFLNKNRNSSNIFVNSGIGSPEIRLFTNPEILLITLKSLQ